ncbi:hypothetical protein [Goodfellowiella coeruleoviolacea]|uniref:Secreted protein n=1 Tax=Goodfellowiella coeruleoviolacea TaxID=334858 RepID=A0AAE3GGE9_9PSEU|nr:hypothetical protein [Goodfellowiella coeruleoviolacea]MCP2166884.1 hypothetical protein [Goodfellowiella coeruleoviolacea]
MSSNRVISVIVLSLAIFVVAGPTASASTQVTAQNMQQSAHGGIHPGGGGTDWS